MLRKIFFGLLAFTASAAITIGALALVESTTLVPLDASLRAIGFIMVLGFIFWLADALYKLLAKTSSK